MECFVSPPLFLLGDAVLAWLLTLLRTMARVRFGDCPSLLSPLIQVFRFCGLSEVSSYAVLAVGRFTCTRSLFAHESPIRKSVSRCAVRCGLLQAVRLHVPHGFIH